MVASYKWLILLIKGENRYLIDMSRKILILIKKFEKFTKPILNY